MSTGGSPRAERLDRTRERMSEIGVDVLLVSVGADLPWLTGYEAMPLERLTMLVVPVRGDATLVVPKLEAPRVGPLARELCEVLAWPETDDPTVLVASLAGGAKSAAIGDHTWARFVLDLQMAMPSTVFSKASSVTGPLRAIKDDGEITALRLAAHGVDAIAQSMSTQRFSGRAELEIHRELVERMLDGGHDRTNFAIVATGPNGASPHHDPGARVIEEGDLVLCDFGGTMGGYCSDITRMFVVGEPPVEIARAYEVLAEAQEAAVNAAAVGTPCEEVDATARRIIESSGFAGCFIHRIGHGIGVEAHEDPYLVAGNPAPLEAGHVFSIEPGIYLPGQWGMRLEDIVLATPTGPERLNTASRELANVE